LDFKVLPVPDTLVFKAAELKAEYTISYTGCFALACALDQSAILVTGDPEFKKVTTPANILWIR
jgi:ribonuclease VapC